MKTDLNEIEHEVFKPEYLNVAEFLVDCINDLYAAVQLCRRYCKNAKKSFLLKKKSSRHSPVMILCGYNRQKLFPGISSSMNWHTSNLFYFQRFIKFCVNII